MKLNLLAILASLITCACVPNVRPDSYSIGAVGQVNRTVEGTVISTRQVHIDGARGGGATAGGLAGGIAGSQIGGNDAVGAIGAVGGLVAGSIAGAAIERGVSSQVGMEYIVETTNGAMLTIVQGVSDELQVGSRVLVLYGNPARVIADPRSGIKAR